MREDYIGHESQLYGVEEHRLVGGKGDGMRLFEVKNGLGLQFTLAADRCADLYRLSFKGDNYGFFSPSGYVGPAYYDARGQRWLESFTAGLITTCGLDNVGIPCTDAGEELGQHGAIASCPAENVCWDMDDERIWVKASVRQARIFSRKLVLERTWSCSKTTNELTMTDKVRNLGGEESPLMLLYHINLGYPLLTEQSEVWVPSSGVQARDERAAEGLDSWMTMQPPTPGFAEQCYFHDFGGRGAAGMYSPAIGKGLVVRFDPAQLDCFTEWKMMGVRDYVLGLEPGNCRPTGRAEARKDGSLKFIAPGEEKEYSLRLQILDGEDEWAAAKQA